MTAPRPGWLLVALSTTAALAACDKSVDSAEFEGNVKQRLAAIGFPDATATCPKKIAAKVGAEFTCDVGIEGKTYALNLTITKVDGKRVDMDSKWKDGDAIVAERLEAGVANQLTQDFGAPVTIDCGEPLRFLDADRKVACTLTAGAAKTSLKIAFDDKLTPTGWEIDPVLVSKAKLETILAPDVSAKSGAQVTVTCGAEPLFARPADGVTTCDATDGKATLKIKVTLDASGTPTAWDTVL